MRLSTGWASRSMFQNRVVHTPIRTVEHPLLLLMLTYEISTAEPSSGKRAGDDPDEIRSRRFGTIESMRDI
jgi:hypothetical protein